MKNAPGWVLAVCATIIFVVIVGAFVFLSATGADATEFRSFLNTLLNVGSVLLGGGAFVAAGAAAKSAANAEKQTNGAPGGVQDTIRQVIKDELNGGENNGRGPTV